MSEYVKARRGSPSGLTDRERSLLCYLAIRSVVHDFGMPEDHVADMLDEGARRDMVHIRGDQEHVLVTFDTDSGSTVLVNAERVALRQAAHPTGQLDN
jgi:hypothetical protein